MPFTYSIDVDQRFVLITAQGRITSEEAFDKFDEIAAHPDFGPNMRVLSDHRALETVVSVGFVKTFVARIRALRESFQGSRCAFVESGAVRYGMARMASILSDPTVIELRAFHDIDEARRWLEVEAAASES